MKKAESLASKAHPTNLLFLQRGFVAVNADLDCAMLPAWNYCHRSFHSQTRH